MGTGTNTKVVAKVLSYKKGERYAVDHAVRAAWNVLIEDRTDQSLEIVYIREVAEILKYTPVFVFASLVINEKLVCVGRIPKRDEVIDWLRAAIAEMSPSQEEESLSHE
jgi:hypothetical protein